MEWSAFQRWVCVNGGHYSPAGNHLFAYNLKNVVVDWLEPKPMTYITPPGDRIAYGDYMKRVIGARARTA